MKNIIGNNSTFHLLFYLKIDQLFHWKFKTFIKIFNYDFHISFIDQRIKNII